MLRLLRVLLDVYKRQGAPEIGTFLHANLERLGTQLLSEHKQWHELDAVSYTHLDVYKRQVHLNSI